MAVLKHFDIYMEKKFKCGFSLLSELYCTEIEYGGFSGFRITSYKTLDRLLLLPISSCTW